MVLAPASESASLELLAARLSSLPLTAWPSALGAFARSGLRPALAALLEDDRAIRSIAARSYAHGNGFNKVVLAEENGVVVRLHVAEGASEDNIHDHRWSFASTVLTGALENVTFAESDDGVPCDELRYLRDGASTEAVPIRTCRVREVGRRRYGPGDAYVQDRATLHRIRWSAGCRTLMVTQRPVSGSCRLLTTGGSPKLRGAPLARASACALLSDTVRMLP